MDKENVVHLHNGVLDNRKKNNILNFADKWMELENINLSEETPTQRDNHYMFSHISGF